MYSLLSSTSPMVRPLRDFTWREIQTSVNGGCYAGYMHLVIVT